MSRIGPPHDTSASPATSAASELPNPVDGFILNVILRKAEKIREELGVLVPLPADEQRTP